MSVSTSPRRLPRGPQPASTLNEYAERLVGRDVSQTRLPNGLADDRQSPVQSDQNQHYPHDDSQQTRHQQPRHTTDCGGLGTSNSFTDITSSLRPVQEYHSAFTSADASDDVFSTPSAAARSPLKGATTPRGAGAAAAATTATALSSASAASAASSSPFATLSSASRAFLAHRRQQSIPNLLPSFSSIGKNLGRAISPDRSQRPARPPIPVYAPNSSVAKNRDESGSESESESESDSESGAGGGDDDDDRSYTSSEDDGSEIDNRVGMARFTGDVPSARRPPVLASHHHHGAVHYASRDSNDSSVSGSLATWLSAGGKRGGSPDRVSIAPASRVTTPEPTMLALRTGGRVDSAGDTPATPRGSGPAPAATSPSRFSQFASSMTATITRLTTQQQQQSTSIARAAAIHGLDADEFYNLDISAALFPSGQPSDHNAFSPSAFKNLEANAIGLLTRLQAAYRERALAMHDLVAEKSAGDEELEEAETRARHLKMQLEGMAGKAAEQEREMKALAAELAAEKKARAQERAMLLAGLPTMPPLPPPPAPPPSTWDDDRRTTVTTAPSEDLGVEEAQRQQKRQRQRQPRRTADGDDVDDDEFEDEDADADADADSVSSVFSRSRSPTIAPSIDISVNPAPHPRVTALGSGRATKPSPSAAAAAAVAAASSFSSQPSTQLTAFQKLMKNITSALKEDDVDRAVGPDVGQTSCRNCRGQDVSFAWNTVSVLRDENKHLKQRVGQLEVAVEGALDLVNGVGMD